MIKLVCFVRRHPALDRETFHRHWAEQHGPLIAGESSLARHLRRYEQNSRLEGDYARDPDGYDGVTVQWLDDWQSFLDFVAEPAYREVLAPDEAYLLDRGGLGLIFTDATTVQIDPGRARAGAGAKLLGLVHRAPALGPQAFRDHWTRVHGPMIRDSAAMARHLLGYEQSHRSPADYERTGGSGPDGLVEMWFESGREIGGLFGEPEYRERVVPDEDLLIDRGALESLVCGPPRVIIDGPVA